MNVREFARTVVREIRGDDEFWDGLLEEMAERTTAKLLTLPPLQRRSYTVKEAAGILGLGPQAVRNAVERGELRCVRVGTRVIIPLTAIAKLLGDELVLHHDGAMEIDMGLLESITAVAEDVESGRFTPKPGGPDWLILARELAKTPIGGPHRSTGQYREPAQSVALEAAASGAVARRIRSES